MLSLRVARLPACTLHKPAMRALGSGGGSCASCCTTAHCAPVVEVVTCSAMMQRRRQQAAPVGQQEAKVSACQDKCVQRAAGDGSEDGLLAVVILA